MITPSPTTRIDAAIARGTLGALVGETATKPAYLTFEVPNTNYVLHLRPTAAISTPPGKRLLGTIRVEAKRIDVVTTGGKYLEPVMGRPRRVQGTVVRTEGGAVVVDAGVPVHLVPTDPRQNASQFEAGTLVSCDVLEGATFTPR